MADRRGDILTELADIRDRIDKKLTRVAGESGAALANSYHAAHLRGTLAKFEERVAQTVESQPPAPPTLRGRLGAQLERLVQRALFWQYAQASEAQASLVSHLRATEQSIAHLEMSLATSQKRVALLEDEVAFLKSDLQRAERRAEDNNAQREQRHKKVTDALQSEIQRLSTNDEAKWLNDNRPDLYLKFEDLFRGTEEDISNRLRVYLPKLTEYGIDKNSDIVVDVGCGRGEWLTLLTQEGYKARGCDSNSAMVDLCRKSSLDVMKLDGVEFLNSLRPSSAGAITSLHVIEHLPLNTLLEFLESIHRALRPGGIMILETPNPLNALVGFHNFYLDPTHRKPVPSALLRFLAESKDFKDVEITPLHPHADWLRLPEESETSKRYNEQFYGPQDYALVAVRP